MTDVQFLQTANPAYEASYESGHYDAPAYESHDSYAEPSYDEYKKK
jgi:hypothetical protein